MTARPARRPTRPSGGVPVRPAVTMHPSRSRRFAHGHRRLPRAARSRGRDLRCRAAALRPVRTGVPRGEGPGCPRLGRGRSSLRPHPCLRPGTTCRRGWKRRDAVNSSPETSLNSHFILERTACTRHLGSVETAVGAHARGRVSACPRQGMRPVRRGGSAVNPYRNRRFGRAQ